MKSIPIQQDNVTQLSADDFNEIPREIENAIESAGITLSSGDLSQLAKALATYAAVGDFYNDVGTSTAYQLDAVSPHKAPPAYYLGMRVRFVPANYNSAESATLQVGALGVLNVGIGALPNGGPFELEVNQIRPDADMQLVIAQTPDGTKYWRLDSTSLSNLSNGDTTIVGPEGWDMRIRDSQITITHASTGIECAIGRNAISQEEASGLVSKFKSGQMQSRETNSANQRGVLTDWQGMGFDGGTHPNQSPTSRFNKTYDLLTPTGLTFANGGAGDNLWVADAVFSTSIPSACRLYPITAQFTDDNGDQWTAPCTCKMTNNVGTWDILIGINAAGSSAGFEPQVSGMAITIEFDGQFLS